MNYCNVFRKFRYKVIARVINKVDGLNLSHVLIIHYIKVIGNKIENEEKMQTDRKNIPVIELDELYTDIKKNSKMEGKHSEFGLLWTATTLCILHLK